LYVLLALFDRRDGTPLADIIRAAREGWEREDTEDDAWAEFDARWDRYTSAERLEMARSREVEDRPASESIKRHAEAATGVDWDLMDREERAGWLAWGMLTIGGMR
jgi:hypothetical protein